MWRLRTDATKPDVLQGKGVCGPESRAYIQARAYIVQNKGDRGFGLRFEGLDIGALQFLKFELSQNEGSLFSVWPGRAVQPRLPCGLQK